MIRATRFAILSLVAWLCLLGVACVAADGPPPSGDWVITERIELVGQNVTVNGSIVVRGDGVLLSNHSRIECENVSVETGRLELKGTDLVLTGPEASTVQALAGGVLDVQAGSIVSTSQISTVNLVAGCSIVGTQLRGIGAVNVAMWRVTVRNCTLEGSTGNAIIVRPLDMPNGFIDVSGNLISGAKASGILIDLLGYRGDPVVLRVTGNHIVDAVGSGIYMTTGYLDGLLLDLHGNRIETVGSHGVFMSVRGEDLEVDLNQTLVSGSDMDGVRLVLDVVSVRSLGLSGITGVNNVGYGFSIFSLYRETGGLVIRALNASGNAEGGVYLSGVTEAVAFDPVVLNPGAIQGDYVMDVSSLFTYGAVHGKAQAKAVGSTAAIVSLRRLNLTFEWQDGAAVGGRTVHLLADAGEELLNGTTDEQGWLGHQVVCEWGVYSGNEEVRYTFRPVMSGEGWSVQGQDLPMDRDHDTTLMLFDDIPPALTVLHPASNTALNTSSLTVSGSCSDDQSWVALVQVSLDDAADWEAKEWTDAEGTDQWACNLEGLEEGEHTLYVRAYDGPNLPGGVFTRIVVANLTVDTVPPVLDVSSPMDGTLTNHQELMVQGSVEAGSHVTVDGVAALVQGGFFSAVLRLVEGTNQLPVSATDRAGNQNWTMVIITLDTIPPALVVEDVVDGHLEASPEGCYVRGWTEATARLTVALNGLRQEVTMGPDGHFGHPLPSAREGDMIAILATDPAGNVNGTELLVVIASEPPGGSGMAPVVWSAALAGTMIVLGAMVGVETVRYSTLVAIAPLYARIRRERVLDNRFRYLIHGIIIDNPGIHFRALLRELGLSNGVAVYHLDVLEREGFIRSVRDGRLRRFFSTNVRVPSERRPTPEQLCERFIRLVGERPGISQKELIEELGLPRRVVGYHINELVSKGDLVASRRGRNTVYTVRTKKRGARTSDDGRSAAPVGRGSKG